jgi:TonB family protein
MDIELQTSEIEKRPLYSLGSAFLMAMLVFLIIPLTQTTNHQTPKTIDLRNVLMVQPPAPAKPAKATEQPPAKEPTPTPSFQKQFTEPDFTQLELSLNPSIDEALAIGQARTGFEMEADAVSDIKKLFTFSDLPEAPRIINHPKIQFPKELIRRGIKEGRVLALIEIDERGRAKIVSVKSSTHPLLIKEAEKVIRQAQFTGPLIDGVAQRVRGEWPIDLRAPK